MEKVIFLNVYLGKMGERLLSLGCWLRLLESAVEKVAVKEGMVLSVFYGKVCEMWYITECKNK